jgi:hypothetical protein
MFGLVNGLTFGLTFGLTVRFMGGRHQPHAFSVRWPNWRELRWLVGWLVGGLMFGLVTGLMFGFLLRHVGRLVAELGSGGSWLGSCSGS